jgi:transposase
MTGELLALGDWLRAEGCTHVAMESTNSYWRPVYNLLEGQVELLVANAYHIKTVPGRKTDIKDAEWIADLLRHGLLRGSFIPAPEQRQLRDVTRYRTHLVEERARLTNRLQAVLEDANIKLAAVVTDVRGVSARAILDALVAGETDAALLAELARAAARQTRTVGTSGGRAVCTASRLHDHRATEPARLFGRSDEAHQHRNRAAAAGRMGGGRVARQRTRHQPARSRDRGR